MSDRQDKIQEGLRTSIIPVMAKDYGLEPTVLELTLQSLMPEKGTWELFTQFLFMAKHYKLNPITREIFPLIVKGRMVCVVSVDGWSNLINQHPMADGIIFHDIVDAKGELTAITCSIYRKDRKHPIEVTEYMKECRQTHEKGTPWDKWPNRMLRHKALIQCARYAFGFAGIYDTDEAERIERGMMDITPPSPPEVPSPPPAEDAVVVEEPNGRLKEQLEKSIDVTKRLEDWDARLHSSTFEICEEIFTHEIDPAHERGEISEAQREVLVAIVMEKPAA